MRRRIWTVVRKPYRRIRNFILYQILHTDDPPSRLALGVAIGVFVAFTPTFGFQMGIAFGLAWLLRANRLIGLPIVWITNPATFVPIYYACYWIGRKILGQPGVGFRWWSELQGVHGPMFYRDKLMEVATPLWLGCLVVGLALAYPSYLITLSAVQRHRLKRWGDTTRPARAPRSAG